MRTPENSWLQGTLINKSSSKSLHTYTETKHHPTANKFQSKTYHTNSLETQECSPELQNTGCPKSHQIHWHIKTHYWTLHCSPETRNLAPPIRTPTQASLTRKPWQATHPTPPTGRNFHNKQEPQTAKIWKDHPKHSNKNKIKRQRNNQQVKEQDKCPWNKTKEEETGNLPDKEFQIMIVKMIQNLENKMELQINSLKKRIESMQEMFNKDLEEIKKSQFIMNNAINEIKSTLEETNSRIT